MASVGTSYIASAKADSEGRLVEAGEPLASLQEACSGQIGGPIAIPELQALVDKANTYGLRLARQFTAIDGDNSILLIFIAGGSGLSSPQSMILDLLEQNDERKIVLFQGARNLAELYNRELFEALDRDHDNFTYVPALSQAEDDADWQGFRGYVHDAAKEHFGGRFSGNKAYLCGPPPMIDAAITALMQGRLFERDIFMEKFLTAADGAEDTQRSALFKKI